MQITSSASTTVPDCSDCSVSLCSSHSTIFFFSLPPPCSLICSAPTHPVKPAPRRWTCLSEAFIVWRPGSAQPAQSDVPCMPIGRHHNLQMSPTRLMCRPLASAIINRCSFIVFFSNTTHVADVAICKWALNVSLQSHLLPLVCTSLVSLAYRCWPADKYNQL